MTRINKSIGKKFFLIMLLLLSGCSILIYLFITIALPSQYEEYIAQQEQKKMDAFYADLNGKSTKKASDLIYEYCLLNDTTVFIFKDQQLLSAVPYSKEGEPYTFTYTVVDDLVEAYVLKQIHNTNWFSPLDENAGHPNGIVTQTESSWLVRIDQALEGADEQQICVKSTLSLADGNTYTVYTRYERQPIKDVSVVLGRLFRIVFPFILLISVAMAFLYSKVVARPIISLNQSAQEMAKMNLEVRCHTKRKDEIGMLGQSLNELSINLSNSLEELEQKNKTLKSDIAKERELDKKRRDFFNMASHEMKTPITVLKGYLEGMIYHVGVYQDRDEYLARSLKKLEQMEALVGELLDISRLDHMSISSKNKCCDLAEIVLLVLDDLQDLAEKRCMKIDNQMKSSIVIKADQNQMIRVMANIMKNAVVHSPEGEQIQIYSQETNEWIEIAIANTGVTIPEEDLPYLFQPFYRVDKSHSHHTGGSGLGLYTISAILDSCQFEYGIHNIQNGVEFYIRIPFESWYPEQNDLS